MGQNYFYILGYSTTIDKPKVTIFVNKPCFLCQKTVGRPVNSGFAVFCHIPQKLSLNE
jgi:hypothetical protein